ncbi:MAG: hypothetical protein ACRDRL_19220 [Sciscionella sp.]
MPSVAIEQLRALGLQDCEAEVYLRLLSVGAATVEQMSHLLTRQPNEVRAACATLLGVGLAGTVDGDLCNLVPVPPGPALALLTRQREVEFERAKLATLNAFETCGRAGAGHSGAQLVEAISVPAVHERLAVLERGARKTVRAMESPPYYACGRANAVELANLERGVTYRAVYATAALEQSENFDAHVLPAIEAGEQARTLPDVPVKLYVIDDSCAVVSMPAMTATVGAAALLIQPCSLLSAVIGLFEMCWRTALPLGGPDGRRLTPGVSDLQPSDRRLLGLLAVGVSDDRAARSLGVSRRTFYRYLEGLLIRTGTQNRFQLAAHAARQGGI